MKDYTIKCDLCGQPTTVPERKSTLRRGDYEWRICVSRLDTRRIRGAYVPPYRTLDICHSCKDFIASLFDGENGLSEEAAKAYEKHKAYKELFQ